ncbi:unnamed protein product [Ranitomeya imitator]|uniref:Uncharacterized protein n=1 Tax=Ranitomeya imitator TaxID=111125 RepID=A0ABN9LVD8_9NEOB|nr:unnamed protein product [Ranitomeya imitator]
MQNALVSFKELCGLTPAANMKQCILTLSAWLLNSDSPLTVTLNLRSQYPLLEAQGPVPDLLKKVFTSYEAFIQASRTLIETSDAVYSKIIQVQKTDYTRLLPHNLHKEQYVDMRSHVLTYNQWQCLR